MNIISIVFRILAYQGVIMQAWQLLAPVIGDLIGQSVSAADVRPADYLSKYDTQWTQTALVTLGAADLVVDGDYGEETAAAVKAFQASHPPLKADGIAGVQTIATLETELGKLI